ncbi:N-terminal acetyltransferase A complex catalytic subunit ard1 [Paramarasmius palmivorus]|uniref:N-terminal acetyltransferase A complex catalytic subunit ard1 n=1 Tax=Paramarasmius palmivorus TaxID=297713 RepID=A0AAW0CR30_9AGAR
MFTIRLATIDDLPALQATNLQNLPENYVMRFWIYHLIAWPQLSYVAEAVDEKKGKRKIVGYVLGKIDDDEEEGNFRGHVNSISVLRSYRRLGLAKRLMERSQDAMSTIYNARACTLHVRASNKAAIGLYRDTLGFDVEKIEKGYCE